MKYSVYNTEGKEVETLELPKEIFEVKPNNDLVHQAVVTQKANARKPLAHTKDRGEVSGGGVKPWRQKGTGRARHGSIRSPIWVGGGVSGGPTKERTFKKKINKKMKRKALFCILSQKAKENEIILVDNLILNEPKTKLMVKILNNFKNNIDNLKNRKPFTFLVIPERKNENIIKSVRNLAYAKTLLANSLNVVDLLSYKYVVMPKESIEVIKKTYIKTKEQN